MTIPIRPVVSCGIDLVHLGTFERAVEVTGGKLLDACFTIREREQAGDRLDRLAARFAAKEAAAKALGVGMMRGIGWHDIEFVRDGGRPELALNDAAAQVAGQQGWYSWSTSISHEGNAAVAVVIALRSEENEEGRTDDD